jgi:cytoskeletal protein RodZ
MKTVGKQLQDARMAKGWSPELAARETKIRVDRVHDLEVDDYSNFSSPTYARGFVRTYARALGLDEYKILRQLDNKLPEDDNATFINDGGVPYMPEPSKVSKPFEVGRGVYIAGGVTGVMLLLIGFILVQSYRAGYFASTPAATPAMPATNAAPIAPETETARALPADGSAPPVPLPADTTPVATAVAPAALPADTNAAPLRALPVNLADLAGSNGASAPAAPVAVSAPASASANTVPSGVTAGPNASPAFNSAAESTTAAASAPAVANPTVNPNATAPSIAAAPDAAPATVAPGADTVSPATQTATPDTVSTATTTPPRALPVDLGASAPAADEQAAATQEPAFARPHPVHSLSARGSDSRNSVDVAAANSATDSLIAATAPAEQPTAATAPASAAPAALTGTPGNAESATIPAPAASSPENAAPSSLAPVATAAPANDPTSALTGAPGSADTAAPTADANPAQKFHGQRLVLTASHDSFVRVVALDGPNAGQVRYASTLHSGQSISFNGRKYSINVADPAAVDIALDGINYGPHSENPGPDTFTVESRTP